MLQIRLGNMGLRKAAKHYQIPKSTLSDKVAGKYKMGSKPGRPQKLSHDDEVLKPVPNFALSIA
jgi:transposase